jgi:hypothetical protein
MPIPDKSPLTEDDVRRARLAAAEYGWASREAVVLGPLRAAEVLPATRFFLAGALAVFRAAALAPLLRVRFLSARLWREARLQAQACTR